MTRKTIILTHIPKCGGTSLLKQLQASGLNLFLDYDHFPSELAWFDNRRKHRDRETSFLTFERFDVVIGHFPIWRYASELYDHAVILRDPVERAISEYFFYKYVVNERNPAIIAAIPLIASIKSNEVSFVEFLRRMKIDRFYLRYVDRMDTSTLRLVGFHDDYAGFCRRLSGILGVDISPDVRARENHQKETITADEMDEARSILADEIAWYREQRAKWGGF